MSFCVHPKSLQMCPTLCDHMDYSLPDFSVRGILQQEYWNGLPCPPPGDLPDPGIKPTSPVSPALAGRFFTTEPPGSVLLMRTLHQLYIKFNI